MRRHLLILLLLLSSCAHSPPSQTAEDPLVNPQIEDAKKISSDRDEGQHLGWETRWWFRTTVALEADSLCTSFDDVLQQATSAGWHLSAEVDEYAEVLPGTDIPSDWLGNREFERGWGKAEITLSPHYGLDDNGWPLRRWDVDNPEQFDEVRIHFFVIERFEPSGGPVPDGEPAGALLSQVCANE